MAINRDGDYKLCKNCEILHEPANGGQKKQGRGIRTITKNRFTIFGVGVLAPFSISITKKEAQASFFNTHFIQ